MFRRLKFHIAAKTLFAALLISAFAAPSSRSRLPAAIACSIARPGMRPSRSSSSSLTLSR